MVEEKQRWQRKLYIAQKYPDTYIEPASGKEGPDDPRRSMHWHGYLWANVRDPDPGAISTIADIYMVADNCSILIICGFAFSLVKERPAIFSHLETLGLMLLVVSVVMGKSHRYPSKLHAGIRMGGMGSKLGGAIRAFQRYRSAPLVGLYLQILTPMHRHLLHSVSSDTIYLFSLSLSAVLILPFKIASLSAGMFISIMLCSRFDGSYGVGGFMLLCIGLTLYVGRSQHAKGSISSAISRRCVYFAINSIIGAILTAWGRHALAVSVLGAEAFFSIALPSLAIYLRKYKSSSPSLSNVQANINR